MNITIHYDHLNHRTTKQFYAIVDGVLIGNGRDKFWETGSSRIFNRFIERTKDYNIKLSQYAWVEIMTPEWSKTD